MTSLTPDKIYQGHSMHLAVVISKHELSFNFIVYLWYI